MELSLNTEGQSGQTSHSNVMDVLISGSGLQ